MLENLEIFGKTADMAGLGSIGLSKQPLYIASRSTHSIG